MDLLIGVVWLRQLTALPCLPETLRWAEGAGEIPAVWKVGAAEE